MAKVTATSRGKGKAKRSLKRDAGKLGGLGLAAKTGQSGKTGRFVTIHKSSLSKPVTKRANITSADADKAVRTYLLELTH